MSNSFSDLTQWLEHMAGVSNFTEGKNYRFNTYVDGRTSVFNKILGTEHWLNADQLTRYHVLQNQLAPMFEMYADEENIGYLHDYLMIEAINAGKRYGTTDINKEAKLDGTQVIDARNPPNTGPTFAQRINPNPDQGAPYGYE